MPIYAFACEACGHHFDRLQKLSDPDPENCPQCGQAQVHRQLTAPSFRLAGSGWYETDFKTDRDKKHNLAGDNDDAKTASEAKSGESKSASGSKPSRESQPASNGKAEPTPAPAPAAPRSGKAAPAA
jgi:putative FmdB family regulatory protein